MEQPHDPSDPRRSQPRFTLTALFVIMLVASVMAAAGFYVAREIQTGRQRQFAFVMITLIAPVFLIVVLGSLVSLMRWINRQR